MAILSNLPEWALILGFLFIATLGPARMTRILTYDDFPPAAAVRMAWDRLTNDGPWSKLVHCFWCMNPWMTLASLLWLGAGVLWADWIIVAWVLFWGWLAISYLGSIIIGRDEPADGAE